MHLLVTQQEGWAFSGRADQKKPLLVVWVYFLLSSRHCVALKLPASDETLFTVLSFSSLVSLKVRGMDYLLIQKDATPCHVPEGSVFQLHTHTLCTWFVSAGNCIWCLQANKRQGMHVKSWRSLMLERFIYSSCESGGGDCIFGKDMGCFNVNLNVWKP